MSDGDEALRKKHEILEGKYKALRRNHKKLAGVALELTRALEAFIKDEEKPDISKILLSCSTIYPGLMTNAESSENEADNKKEHEEAEESEKGKHAAEEEGDSEKSEKEYFEGFWSRPKIPRTPQI